MFHQKPLLGQRINWAHSLSKGLVGCWVMNEGSGDKTYDLSGNMNAGTISGAKWRSDAIEFGGVDDKIQMPHSSVYDFSGPFSVVIKVLISDSNQTNDIFSKWDGIDAGFVLLFTSTSRFYFMSGGTTAGNAATTPAGFPYNDNQFYTVVGVYDGTDTKIYVDGMWIIDAADPLAPVQVNTPLRVGLRYNDSNDMEGMVEYVYTYDQALTPQQIQALHISPYTIFEDPLPIELMAVAAGGEEHIKNLSDTINLSDARIFMYGLNKSDSITLSDLPIKNVGRPLTDSISMSDVIAKSVGLPESDSIIMSDGIAKTPGLPKSDTITLSDNASTVASFLRSLNDTINLSDGAVKSFRTTKADTITLTDNLVSTIIAIIMNINDTINLSDGLVKNIGTARSDTINLSDNFGKVIAYLRSFADTITLSDLGLREAGLNKADTINLSDGITKEPRLSKSDIITLSDSIAKELGLSRADTITLSDFFSSDAGIVWTNIIIKGIDIMSGEPVFITGKYRLP